MPWGTPASEEGSCEEEELDLVKAFLRDSDSDCEDAYYIQPSSSRQASLGGAAKPSLLQVMIGPLQNTHDPPACEVTCPLARA
jgi:hypothetical protein